MYIVPLPRKKRKMNKISSSTARKKRNQCRHDDGDDEPRLPTSSTKSLSEHGMVIPEPPWWSKPNSYSTLSSSATNAGCLRYAVGTTNSALDSPTYTAKWPLGTAAPPLPPPPLARWSLDISCCSFPPMAMTFT
jgi:hypothetical protein